MTLTSCLHFSFPKRHRKPISNTRADIQTFSKRFWRSLPRERRGEDAACAISGFRDCLRAPNSTGFECGGRVEDQFQDTEVASGEVLFELVFAGYDVMGIDRCFFEVFVRIWSFW